MEALHRAVASALRPSPPLQSSRRAHGLQATGSVVDFQDRFEARLPRAGYLSEAQKVQLFTAGLPLPLSLDVEIHNPQSLAVAMSLARKLELRDQCVAPVPPASHASQRGILPPPQRLALPTTPACGHHSRPGRPLLSLH